MRTAIALGVGVLVAMVIAVPAQAQNIKGDWKLETCTINGEKVPSNKLEDMKLSLTYTNFEATAGGRSSTGKIDNQNRQKPARITFTVDEGEDAGRVLKGIYQRKGTELQIVFSRSDEYPTSFESSSSNEYALMTYSYIKRARKTMTDDERRKKRAPSEIRGMRGG